MTQSKTAVSTSLKLCKALLTISSSWHALASYSGADFEVLLQRVCCDRVIHYKQVTARHLYLNEPCAQCLQWELQPIGPPLGVSARAGCLFDLASEAVCETDPLCRSQVVSQIAMDCDPGAVSQQRHAALSWSVPDCQAMQHWKGWDKMKPHCLELCMPLHAHPMVLQSLPELV